MKVALRALTQKAVLVSAAFVLIVSTMAASMPFILFQKASAISTVYSEDFETGVGDWSDTTRVASGAIPAADGSYYGQVAVDAFTRWGGYQSVFPNGGYTTKIDVYLDMAEANGSDKRFDFSSAINNTSGDHRRDFIFNIGTDKNHLGQWLANVSNNAPGWPANSGNVAVTQTGWYTLQSTFRDDGTGVLAVDMSVISKSDNTVVGSWTLSNGTDVIGVTVGGNRYGWFTSQRFDFASLAIDNAELIYNYTAPIDVYVDDDYTSASAGGHVWGYDAFDNIQAGLNAVAEGGTVYLMNGTYTEKVTFPHSDITLLGENRNNTIIKPLSNAQGMGIYGQGVDNITIKRLTINTNSSSGGSAIKFYDSHKIALRNLQINGNIADNMRGIDINGVKGITIANTDVTGFGKNGIAITSKFDASDTYTTGNVTLNNVTSSNNGWYGIVFYTMNGPETLGSDISGVKFLGNNEFSNNGQSGLGIIGDTDNLISILTGPSVPRWSVTGPSGAILDLGDTTFAGNTILDIVNYQAEDVDANGVNINGKIGSAMNASELNAAELRILDNNDISNYGDVILDSVAPDAPVLTSPSNNFVMQGASVTQSWSDTSSDVDHYIYESYNDAGATSLRWHEETTGLSKTATNVANATYWWRVKAVDYSGNESDWSPLWKLTIDNDAPTVTITSPTVSLTNNNVEVRATVTDPNLRHYWFEIKKDGTGIKSQTVLSSGITNGLLYTITESGVYSITVAARDLAGGTASSGNRSADVVATVVVDLNNPTAAISATPSPAGGVSNIVNVTGDASDTNVASYQLIVTASDSSEVYNSGVVAHTTSGAIAPYDWDVSGLASGVYTATLTVTDLAGNSSTATTNITVDNQGPAATITTTGTQNTATPTIGGDVDADATSLELSIDGLLQTLTWNPGDLTWSFTTATLGEGDHTVVILARDNLGNEGGQNGTITIDLPDNTQGGGTTPATPQATVTPGAVLGDNTTDQNANDDSNTNGEAVEGTSTEKTAAQATTDTDNNDGTIFGLAWYWWLLILAAIAALAWWIIAAFRRRNTES